MMGNGVVQPDSLSQLQAIGAFSPPHQRPGEPEMSECRIIAYCITAGSMGLGTSEVGLRCETHSFEFRPFGPTSDVCPVGASVKGVEQAIEARLSRIEARLDEALTARPDCGLLGQQSSNQTKSE